MPPLDRAPRRVPAGGMARQPNAPTDVERRLVDAGAAILSDAASKPDFLHAAMTSAFLPMRDPGPQTVWERRSGAAALRLEAGAILDPATGDFRPVGLPFGTKARLVTIHLTSQALRSGSPVVEVEDSLTAYTRALGLSVDGRAVRAVREQLGRLAAATVRLGYVEGGRATQVNGSIIAGLDLWAPRDPRQRGLWPSVVRLSDAFFADVQRHAIPLDHRAVAALSNSALGLDAYVWLAGRLHRVPVTKPQAVSWVALHQQFGQGFSRLRKFRETFTDTLRRVGAVYPAARVDADEAGLILHHSPPPVAARPPRLSRG